MIPAQGIATDGAHSSKRGLTRLRGVDLSTGEILFEQSIGNRTANVGEFLAATEALRYILLHDHCPATVYSDSLTALVWLRERRASSCKRYPALRKAELLLRIMAAPLARIQVLHWNTPLWGEIPADFHEK